MSADKPHETEYFIGLMSGTSLDGVDAALVEFPPEHPPSLLNTHYLPFNDSLRKRLLDLHHPQPDEIHLAALAGNDLADCYAHAIRALISEFTELPVRAIGCHGQTLRHRPDSGYTLQIGNAARLAELTGITVVADFRNRDIAAGGQGAPLVPAFHARVLAHAAQHRVIANLGGIANITDLPTHGLIRGWDTGPGNMLMDAWVQRHRNEGYDRDGQWAATGKIHADLLSQLMAHPYLALLPPKSAGREQFNLDWLDSQLAKLARPAKAADVQATLLEFTAASLAHAIQTQCGGVEAVYLCGGGAHNTALRTRLTTLLPGVKLATTTALGIEPDWVEAMAFAWLARQTLHQQPGNLPAVTGAAGPRVLGAVYFA
ncbi:MAG: anhydro-N-acetylmuramic acid kinase [Hydrogenophilales bacterium 16-64-46]|nr:MAG: anhydro-N-acetylmuramic acid kinase [Hydrogenophilales bacterium 12-64-13]OYZ05982.1 MAG: anhydro-N-acetylmuramic acid kinase [Hydrogenophilales bacterium 16-64-46]OZA39918.1 MAG: anhydro-N-acetylmuramic acid kinase [Hydrogenophilales bacterium 17-64-34]HQT00347.1 anhydro-N-acetylmuramic acid kinase [Thiobacillus sp.]